MTEVTANAAMPEQFSPIRLFVTLLVLIFCIERAMMFALDDLMPKGAPVWVGAIIDAGLLTAVTSVFVWRLFMRPLRFALLSEAAQAKAITDAAAEGIITIDEHGIIESANRAAFARGAPVRGPLQRGRPRSARAAVRAAGLDSSYLVRDSARHVVAAARN